MVNGLSILKVKQRKDTDPDPVKVRVSGAGAAFDCSIDDISVIGRVVLTIISG
jgi:hypothetical protein